MKSININGKLEYEQLMNHLESMFMEDDIGGVINYIDRYDKKNSMVALPYKNNCLILHNIDYRDGWPLNPDECEYNGFIIKGDRQIYDAGYEIRHNASGYNDLDYDNSMSKLYERFANNIKKHIAELIAKVDKEDLKNYDHSVCCDFDHNVINIFFNDLPLPDIDCSLPEKIYKEITYGKSPVIIDYLINGEDYLKEYANEVFHNNIDCFYDRIIQHDLLAERLAAINANVDNEYSHLHRNKAIYKAVNGKKSVVAVLKRGSKDTSVKIPVSEFDRVLFGYWDYIFSHYLSVEDRKKIKEFAKDNLYNDRYGDDIYIDDIQTLSFRGKVIYSVV